MVHARVDERLLDAVAVDEHRGLVRVLFENRKQVAEQPLLGRCQLNTVHFRAHARVHDSIDRRAIHQRRRRMAATARGARAAVSALVGAVAPTRTGAGQWLRRWFVLLRNRRPSSSRSV
jgi:hypothetical protein